MSFDLQNTNVLVGVIGGLIIIGGAAIAMLKFLFGLNARVDQMTDALKKQTEVQEKMSEKLGGMKEEFSRFAGATEARLDNAERERQRERQGG